MEIAKGNISEIILDALQYLFRVNPFLVGRDDDISFPTSPDCIFQNFFVPFIPEDVLSAHS